MANHQSPNQEPRRLALYGDVYSDQIIKHVKSPLVLCYSGMSGTGTATALMLALHAKKFAYPLGMLFVRKEDEPAGGNKKISWHNIHHEGAVFCFVDDQIGTGRTFARVRKGLREELLNRIKLEQAFTEQAQRSYPETDEFGQVIPYDQLKWITKDTWKPEITLACLRTWGLHSVSPPSKTAWGEGLMGPHEPLFVKEVTKIISDPKHKKLSARWGGLC